MFFSEAQAPPMAEIVRQTAKRYHHSSFGSNSSIEVTPQHGPMKASYQPSYDTQVYVCFKSFPFTVLTLESKGKGFGLADLS